jgi:hypothetical protein
MILPLQSRQNCRLWGFHHLEMPAQGSRCLFKDAAANKDVVGIEGGDRQDADAIPRLAVEAGGSWLRKQSALLPWGSRGSRGSRAGGWNGGVANRVGVSWSSYLLHDGEPLLGRW